jgi:hypothetical protein
MIELKPIETRYKDCRFRSRLEARWAVFFESMKIPWSYEYEGFELPGGARYLPDFLLPKNDIWVEIKPSNPETGYLIKLTDFAWNLGKRLLLLRGDSPHPGEFEAELFEYGTVFTDAEFLDCRRCDGVWIGGDGWAHSLRCTCSLDRWTYPVGNDRVLKSLSAARSARFEFGESGI